MTMNEEKIFELKFENSKYGYSKMYSLKSWLNPDILITENISLSYIFDRSRDLTRKSSKNILFFPIFFNYVGY